MTGFSPIAALAFFLIATLLVYIFTTASDAIIIDTLRWMREIWNASDPNASKND